MRHNIFAVIAVLSALPLLALDYTIDTAHSSAQFGVRHMMVSNVRGEFSKLTGSISYDESKPAATTVQATIDAASISTREPKRDAHLRSPDFFDVAEYPSLTFKSKRAVKTASGMALTGDLTIHGVTKEVTLNVQGPTPEVKDPWGLLRRGAYASTTINRRDFGLTWNGALEAGGLVVGDEVTITLDIEATRKPDVSPQTSN